MLDARNCKAYSDPIPILGHIHHLYLALHPSTEAVPAAFSTHADNPRQLSCYPFCNVASHRSSLLPQAHVAAEGTPHLLDTRSPTLTPGPSYTSQHPTAELDDMLEGPQSPNTVTMSSHSTVLGSQPLSYPSLDIAPSGLCDTRQRRRLHHLTCYQPYPSFYL